MTPLHPPPVPSKPHESGWRDLWASWPRSAQYAAVSMASVFLTLVAVHLRSSWLQRPRPLEIEHGMPVQFRIDLNEADRSTLLQIPGVGDKMAERILAYRDSKGRFNDYKDLLEIQGVGGATLERMRPWVEIRGGTAMTPVVGKKQARPAAGSSQQAAPAPPAKVALLTEPIPINTASLEELQKLPGVGLKKAQQIIAERERAPFRTLEDLRRVPGFGPKTLETLRPWIMLEDKKVTQQDPRNTVHGR
jgi:competence protein ComEA